MARKDDEGGRRPSCRERPARSAAGVARSTFYEHFDGRNLALIEAIEGPLSLLADAVTSSADEARLSMLLDHFRENRRSAADLLSGPLAGRLRRRFSALLEQQLDRQGGDLALDRANQQLAEIRPWLESDATFGGSACSHYGRRRGGAPGSPSETFER